ncbi:CBS domain-containing protein [Lachnospiraceae bacterium XBB2008]|nr:CBS domain-containing protein [Lachnospiraceae bacterium XBB2008]
MSIDQYIGRQDMKVIEAMKRIDANVKGILYITDDVGILVGSLTDGDIRRWILKKGDLSASVSLVMNPGVKSLRSRDVSQIKKIMEQYKIHSIPVVDQDMKIKDIVFDDTIGNMKPHNADSLMDIPVIIMAGGKGTRLQPYTYILPKPLIPIGDIPILERIMRRFLSYGAHQYYLVINYKKELIKAYFNELDMQAELCYVEEEKPLGTAGGITLINREFDSPVIITNCDIIIDADYSDIVRHHTEMANDMTIVSAVKNTEIPYGVMHTDENGYISGMEEKPRFSFLINTGMYIVNPECVGMIPQDTVFHMTDLAAKMIEAGKRVGMYPISEGSFFDMGEFEELKKMEDWVKDGDKTEI